MVCRYQAVHEWALPKEFLLPSPHDIKAKIFDDLPVSKRQVSGPFWGIKTGDEHIFLLVLGDVVITQVTCKGVFLVEIVG